MSKDYNTTMPQDSAGFSIPVLGLRPSGAKKVTITDTSTRNTVAFSSGVQVVTLYATKDCRVEFGDVTVAATDRSHFIKSGVYFTLSINDKSEAQFTHVAVIEDAAGDDGVLEISERV